MLGGGTSKAWGPTRLIMNWGKPCSLSDKYFKHQCRDKIKWKRHELNYISWHLSPLCQLTGSNKLSIDKHIQTWPLYKSCGVRALADTETHASNQSKLHTPTHPHTRTRTHRSCVGKNNAWACLRSASSNNEINLFSLLPTVHRLARIQSPYSCCYWVLYKTFLNWCLASCSILKWSSSSL